MFSRYSISILFVEEEWCMFTALYSAMKKYLFLPESHSCLYSSPYPCMNDSSNPSAITLKQAHTQMLTSTFVPNALIYVTTHIN